MSGLLKRIQLTQPHSVDWPWPCAWQVLSTAPPCTHPVVCGGVYLGQLQALPRKLVPPPSGFLHQGDPKRVHMEGCSGADSAASHSHPWEHL